MLDIKDIRLRPVYYKEGLTKRGVNPKIIDIVLEMDARNRLEKQIEQLENEVKKLEAAIYLNLKKIAALEEEQWKMVRTWIEELQIKNVDLEANEDAKPNE